MVKDMDPYSFADGKDFGRDHPAELIVSKPCSVPQSSLTWLEGECSLLPPLSSPPCRSVPLF